MAETETEKYNQSEEQSERVKKIQPAAQPPEIGEEKGRTIQIDQLKEKPAEKNAPDPGGDAAKRQKKQEEQNKKPTPALEIPELGTSVSFSIKNVKQPDADTDDTQKNAEAARSQVSSPVRVPETTTAQQSEASADESPEMSPEAREQNWSDQMAQQRINQLRQSKSYNSTLERMAKMVDSPDLDLANNPDAQTLKRIQSGELKGKQKLAVAVAGRVGEGLRERIATGSFTAYLLVLTLAITKDLWDLLTELFDAGFSSTILQIVITSILLVVVANQGIWLKRWLIRKFWARFMAVTLAEFIPIVNFFPWWTISVWLIKRQADRHLREQEEMAEQYDADYEALKSSPDESEAESPREETPAEPAEKES